MGRGFAEQEQIQFPVNFKLKVILDNTISTDTHKKNLRSLFLKLGITYKTFTERLSENKKYISFSVDVKVEDRPTFDNLYSGLRGIPGIKYAL